MPEYAESVHDTDIERLAQQLPSARLIVYERDNVHATHVIGDPVEVRQ